MRIILRETAHAQQPVEHAALLIAVDRAQLGPAERKIAIGAEGGLVDQNMEGAVHRLEIVLLTVHVHRRVHAFLIEIQVAGGLPEPRLADVRGVGEVVAALDVLIAPEVLDDLADHRALGMPVGQPRPGLLVEGEQIKVLDQAPVIALLDLFPPLQVLAQLLGRLPGRAVDALEHRLVGVAAPIGARRVEQLHSLRRDLAGVVHVRASAEIDEIAALVDGKHRLVRLLAVLIRTALQNIRDQLQLVGLIRKDLARLLRANLLVDKIAVFLDHLPHPRFDFPQVLLIQRARQIEVVVETVLNRWANSDFGLRELLQHRGRHHVRR